MLEKDKVSKEFPRLMEL